MAIPNVPGAMVQAVGDTAAAAAGAMADVKTDVFKVAGVDTALQGGGLTELIKADAKLAAFAKALGYIPKFGTEQAKDIEQLSAAMRNMKNISAEEAKILDGINKMVRGEQGEAIKLFADRLTAAAKDIQEYQVALIKQGQDTDNVIDKTRTLTKIFVTWGISNKDIRESIEGVNKSYNASIRITREAMEEYEKNRESLAMLAAFNKKFGIEISDSMKLVNLFKNSLGGGTTAAQVFSDSLEKFALETGQDVNEVFKGFTANMDRFSGLSTQRALESFSRLQSYAKRTGQDLNSIKTNLEGFDDISTGYEKLGKLNRLLMQFGSSIDPMAFMQATDEEQQRMMVEAISRVQNFGGFGTERGKRNLIKAFSEASGQNMQAIQGLLNKTPGFLEDAQAALTKEVSLQAFTADERKALSERLTTSDQNAKAREQLMFATDSAHKMAAKMKMSDKQMALDMMGVYGKLDKTYFKDLTEGKTKEIMRASKEQTKEIIREMATYIAQPGSDLKDAAKNLDKASDRIIQSVVGEPGRMDLTPISSELRQIVDLLRQGARLKTRGQVKNVPYGK